MEISSNTDSVPKVLAAFEHVVDRNVEDMHVLHIWRLTGDFVKFCLIALVTLFFIVGYFNHTKVTEVNVPVV